MGIPAKKSSSSSTNAIFIIKAFHNCQKGELILSGFSSLQLAFRLCNSSKPVVKVPLETVKRGGNATTKASTHPQKQEAPGEGWWFCWPFSAAPLC